MPGSAAPTSWSLNQGNSDKLRSNPVQSGLLPICDAENALRISVFEKGSCHSRLGIPSPTKTGRL